MTNYGTIFAYVCDANITHYEHPNADLDAPDILIEAFQPANDPEFAIFWDDTAEENGKTYVRVCWGESEKSYLAEDAIYDCCYVRYVLDHDATPDFAGDYKSDGRVYETEAAAKKG